MTELTKDNVEFLVVHASATPPDMNIGFKEIDRWHRQRGWMMCGYHTIIRRDGTVEQGRPLPQPGAHARGFNHCSIGICMVGGVDKNGKAENNFTPEQFQSLRWVLDAFIEGFPNARVLGHRDLPDVKKSCPCFASAEWYYGTEEG